MPKKHLQAFPQGWKKNQPALLLGVRNSAPPCAHTGNEEPSAGTQQGGAGMLLSIGKGKLRHGLGPAAARATASPQPGRAELEVFIKLIREQREFSKRRSYVTPPLPSASVIYN